MAETTTEQENGDGQHAAQEDAAQKEVDESLKRTDKLIDDLSKEHEQLKRALEVKLDLQRRVAERRRQGQSKGQ